MRKIFTISNDLPFHKHSRVKNHCLNIMISLQKKRDDQPFQDKGGGRTRNKIQNLARPIFFPDFGPDRLGLSDFKTNLFNY